MDRFDAFVSYSHAADGRLAPAVQTGLQRLARRVLQRRALRVFRDETGLSTNPHLWGSIETALDASDWFVLLASPAAAESAWVEREVSTWLESKPLDHVLIVVTDGELICFPDAGIDAERTTCLPAALVDALQDEPRWLDLRWARDDEQLDLRSGRFRAAVADLAAPIHGMAKDDLESEDVRQQRRARRLAFTGASAITVLAVMAGVAALYATSQRNEANAQRDAAEVQRSAAQTQRDRADEEANRAISRSLASQATALSDTDIGLSLLLGIEGYQHDPSIDTQTGLLNALNGGRQFLDLDADLPNDVAYLASSPDRSTLYVQTLAGDLWAYDSATLTAIGEPLMSGIVEPGFVDVSADGSHLSFSGENGAGVLDLATREIIADGIGGGAVEAHLSPDGSLIIAGLYQEPYARVFDVDTGALVAEVEADFPSPEFISNTRFALQPLGARSMDVYDLVDGQALLAATVEGLPSGGGLSVSPDGSQLIAGGLTGTAILVDTETLEFDSPILQVRGSRAGDFAFSRDGALVQLSSDDGTVTVVDTTTGFEVTSLEGLTGSLMSQFIDDVSLVSISITDGGSGRWTIGGTSAIGDSQQSPAGGSIALRTINNGATTIVLGQHPGEVFVALSDDIAKPTSTRRFGDFGWAMDVAESARLMAVTVFDLDQDGQAQGNGRVIIASLDDLSDVSVVEFDLTPANVALSPDGTLVAAGFFDGRLGCSTPQPVEPCWPQWTLTSSPAALARSHGVSTARDCTSAAKTERCEPSTRPAGS